MRDVDSITPGASIPVRAFGLGSVRLLDGPIRDRQELNVSYLLDLEPDRLLFSFRKLAGLPTPGEPLAGWESPDCGLRGHFVGHYLSACAQGYVATGDARLGDRARAIVAGLVACQDAIGTGYLSAFGEEALDLVETIHDGAWAPYYTLDKLLAGLIAVHRWCDDPQALPAAHRLGDYLAKRISRLSPEQIEGMCRTDLGPNPSNEFGGISLALQDLADATGRAAFDDLAKVFEREWFTGPLVAGEDRLTGLHANTHIPMAMALARRYERTGELRLRDAVLFFWRQTALARSYVNGGSSGPHPRGGEKSKGAEHWPVAGRLAGTLTPKINESCVTHNMMRLTDTLLGWTGDPVYGDFYERAYFNHLLAIQSPDRPGGYLYDHPLRAGSRKVYGGAMDAFWCCYGTSVEAFVRLATGIYHHSADGIWVDMPVASQLEDAVRGVRLQLETRFPDEPHLRLTIGCDRPAEWALRLRVPLWAAGAEIRVNGEPFRAVPGQYAVIRRTWREGDEVQLSLPMSIACDALPGDPTTVAYRYGPLVLAALTEAKLEVGSDARPELAGGDGLRFSIRLADGSRVALEPLNRVTTQPFGVYFTRTA